MKQQRENNVFTKLESVLFHYISISCHSCLQEFAVYSSKLYDNIQFEQVYKLYHNWCI